MERISFEEIYIQFALLLAKRSTCERLKVGAVVVAADYSCVYAVAYNGNASGLPNECDNANAPGNCGCVHAESNALLKTNVGPEMKKIVFVTHSPCLYCAKRMVNKGGVVKVYYAHSYRSDSGLKILDQAGIAHEHFQCAFSYSENH